MAWVKRYYKGNQRVYVQVDDAGELLVESGMIPARYQDDEQAKVYHLSPSHLSEEKGALVTAHSKSSPKPPALNAPERVLARPAADQVVSVSLPETLRDYPHPAPTEHVEIYTDGACQGNPGPCAYGALIRFREHYKELSQYLGHGTNNIAELTAVKAALEAMRRTDLPLHIYTDSTYAIGVLTQSWKAKANQALIGEIKALIARFDQVKLIKVKGHSGHPLNDRADALAVEAIQTHHHDLSAEQVQPRWQRQG